MKFLGLYFLHLNFFNSILEVTLAHFLDDKKQAYVCWFVWMTVGMLTQFAWSTSICVRQKLYIMVFTLSFAVATYGKLFIRFHMILILQTHNGIN